MTRRTHLRTRPIIADQFKAFSVVDAVLSQLADGWVYAIQGNPVFFNHQDATWHAIPEAMRGWVNLWNRLSDRYKLGMDFGPLEKICNRLDVGIPISPDEVAIAAGIVKACKPAYRKMDVYVIGELVKTQKISNAMQEVRLVHGHHPISDTGNGAPAYAKS